MVSDSVVLFRLTDVANGALTVTEHVALFAEPSFVVAVMVAEPGATAVTRPEADTVATAVFDDFHVTLCDAAEGETVAVSWLVAPVVSDSVVLFRLTAVADGAVTVIVHDADLK